jgi:TfoX/Sxy family transcriptional regulator of competence genes
MATDPGTVDFLLGQMEGAGAVTARRMFGEYGIYLDGKMVASVCDDRLFLRDLPEVRALLSAPQLAPPYPSAKPQLVIEDELDDAEAVAALLRAAWAALPEPKPKKGRKR